jgi:hypothetical protein
MGCGKLVDWDVGVFFRFLPRVMGMQNEEYGMKNGKREMVDWEVEGYFPAF